MKTKPFRLLIERPPVNYVRKFRRRGGSYLHPDTAEWKKTVKAYAVMMTQETDHQLWDCPVGMVLVTGHVLPESRSKKDYWIPYCKPDIDNLYRTIANALEGIVYVNDSRIVGLLQMKEAAQKPFVYVEVVPFSSKLTMLEAGMILTEGFFNGYWTEVGDSEIVTGLDMIIKLLPAERS